jgi:hypothetical protein
MQTRAARGAEHTGALRACASLAITCGACRTAMQGGQRAVAQHAALAVRWRRRHGTSRTRANRPAVHEAPARQAHPWGAAARARQACKGARMQAASRSGGRVNLLHASVVTNVTDCALTAHATLLLHAQSRPAHRDAHTAHPAAPYTLSTAHTALAAYHHHHHHHHTTQRQMTHTHTHSLGCVPPAPPPHKTAPDDAHTQPWPHTTTTTATATTQDSAR